MFQPRLREARMGYQSYPTPRCPLHGMLGISEFPFELVKYSNACFNLSLHHIALCFVLLPCKTNPILNSNFPFHLWGDYWKKKNELQLQRQISCCTYMWWLMTLLIRRHLVPTWPTATTFYTCVCIKKKMNYILCHRKSMSTERDRDQLKLTKN